MAANADQLECATITAQLALAVPTRLRSPGLMLVEAAEIATRNLATTIDAAANNATTYTRPGAIVARGAALPNGTTLAEITAIQTAIVTYYINRGGSITENTDTDAGFIGTFPTRAAGRSIHLTHTWVIQAIKEGCSNAALNPNAWERASFIFRRYLRWFTPEAGTVIMANGFVPVACQKNGIPMEYKNIAFDYCHFPLMDPKPDGMAIGAYNAYYKSATAKAGTEKYTTHNVDVTRGKYHVDMPYSIHF